MKLFFKQNNFSGQFFTIVYHNNIENRSTETAAYHVKW